MSDQLTDAEVAALRRALHHGADALAMTLLALRDANADADRLAAAVRYDGHAPQPELGHCPACDALAAHDERRAK